ncbi:uncharacterized protein TNCV_1133281 [Trichonephila clavipes]|nr:uncharacterized protein TNCV_1133281 [Trichonephila clavipes]
MSSKSPFPIQKAVVGIGGEPKSVKKLRSAETFLNSPVTINPHKILNSCHGVISEPDLLTNPEGEFLDGSSVQGLIQARKITRKKDALIIPTKHIILTFHNFKLPTTIKPATVTAKFVRACGILWDILCHKFGHSQTFCRGQLTCSRYASAHLEQDMLLQIAFWSLNVLTALNPILLIQNYAENGKAKNKFRKSKLITLHHM